MIDSFKFLPRLIAAYYQLDDREAIRPIPFTPLTKPLSQCRIALITTGGLYLKERQPPFDLERERHEPTWGDPALRIIPNDVTQAEIGVAHLHINPEFIEHDFNVALPLARLRAWVAMGEVGSMAHEAYSLMGYQGFPPNTTGWATEAAPELMVRMQADQVDGVILIPT
jgi:D-proline reductase (dithiol) PrdB